MDTRKFNMSTLEHEKAKTEHAKMLIADEAERQERLASLSPGGQGSTRNARSKTKAATSDLTKLTLKPKPIHANIDFKGIRSN